MQAVIAAPPGGVAAISNFVKELARRDKKVQRSKRTAIRYPLNAALKLGTPGDAGPIKPLCEAWGSDMSEQGLGMLTQMELLPGRMVAVSLKEITGEAAWMRLRIVYSQRLIGNMVRVGGVFVFEL